MHTVYKCPVLKWHEAEIGDESDDSDDSDEKRSLH
jgi:hypothetical protein